MPIDVVFKIVAVVLIVGPESNGLLLQGPTRSSLIPGNSYNLLTSSAPVTHVHESANFGSFLLTSSHVCAAKQRLGSDEHVQVSVLEYPHLRMLWRRDFGGDIMIPTSLIKVAGEKTARRRACAVELIDKADWLPWSTSAEAVGPVVKARSNGKSCGGTALKRRRWRVAELGFNDRSLLPSSSLVPLRLTVEHQNWRRGMQITAARDGPGT